MRNPDFRNRWWLFIVVLAFWEAGATAEESNPAVQLWEQTNLLLQRREYSLAVNLLENSLDDSDLFGSTKQIQQDLDAVRRLQELAESVEYEAKNLPRSAIFKGRRNPAKWEEESEGVFRFSNRAGVTAVVHVSGNRIFGRFANGKPFRGVRQPE